ncbi:ABC transporter substrate-binding protein [Halothermothrix orenii]|uniref:Extracellular solute-binding protein family 1 n=1 Tax=Halothermothrix orenii (strain H 168 / OCM 544 / DSM 9562) TaxID=373903 RepID=B8D1Z2_HALOH|nr:sugar ABC transporter substrate-binding protein [Halothermothrix orenii]ACL69219.1 extracellular solute-binding protein family 1 [Halothermothrix orenii H 168]
MKKLLLLLMVVSLLAGVAATGLVMAKEPIEIKFVSLAWQKQSIEANKEIVAEWNRTHPDVQVKYIQGTWGSIHDYMITAFETGSVPDVFHYESAAIVGFAQKGYLAELNSLMSEDLKNDILDEAWKTTQLENGKIYGVPFLWESQITLYNKALFKEAGITPPTIDNPWTWEDLREAAKKLTKDTDNDGEIDQWGVGLGLKSPAKKMLRLSVGFGGKFFKKENGEYHVEVGEAEKKLLKQFYAMLYEDKTAPLSGIGQSGSSMIPGFLAGKYAMVPSVGVWARQQVVVNAPENFEWGVIPPIKAKTQAQGVGTQTLSIPSASKYKKEAMEFIEFFLNTRNMARLAKGDWMLPTRKSTMNLPMFQTDENGWKVAMNSAKCLEAGPWQNIPGFPEWKNRVGNPVIQLYLKDKISLEDAAKRLEREGNRILQRYK